MQIPLDYYRILGVPIQATASQLGQAYHDRTLQLPRREYGQGAIASRTKLLDEAYAVLSDGKRRSEYDANFLANTHNLESQLRGSKSSFSAIQEDRHKFGAHPPSIDIGPDQLVGSLMILQELGEYELVLKLGNQTLRGIERSETPIDDPRQRQTVQESVILTLALAYLELGREQWQQNKYDQAAISGQTGYDLLLQNGLFPNIRQEIKSDLSRLRPYRILELVALDDNYQEQRLKGLHILLEMLGDREGIDGHGNDESGLSIDDFLRFIQQLRSYLTSAEQQELFESEACRPSAVATYLAVYALLGRGFSQRQPELISRAKDMLIRLGRRQDVHLEQAVCALLLGQTEEANRALELSQEYEPLAFIREHSVGSPDLLPGLCLYGERWLQTEVFPHFRDLSQQQTSLKEYFADEQVQSYLEQLPGGAESEVSWSTGESERTSPAEFTYAQVSQPDTIAQGSHLGTATLERPSRAKVTDGDVNNGTNGGDSNVAYIDDAREKSTRRRRPSRSKSGRAKRASQNQHLPREKASFTTKGSRQNSFLSSHTGRWLLLGLVAVFGLGLAGLIVLKTVQWLQKTTQSLSGPSLEKNQPHISLSQPPIEMPTADPQVVMANGPLTKEIGDKVIKAWLSVKSDAFGSKYEIEKLKKILAPPILSTWQNRVQTAKASGEYRKYNHEVTVNSVTYSQRQPDNGIVDAAVREQAQAYRESQLNNNASYSENLRVRYYLIRKGDRWLIENVKVLR